MTEKRTIRDRRRCYKSFLALFLFHFAPPFVASQRRNHHPTLDSSSRIWPACQEEEYHNETINFDACGLDGWKFMYSGHYTPVQEVLDAAKDRFLVALRNRIHHHRSSFSTDLKATSRHLGKQQLCETGSTTKKNKTALAIRIHISTIDHTLTHDVDESYQLIIKPSSSTTHSQPKPLIRIKAATVYGAMHGLQTLLQLVEAVVDPTMSLMNRSSSTLAPPEPSLLFAIYNTPIIIYDAPLYPYRGLLIDTSRHYLPLERIILPNLQAMAMNKLNVLHWHLTDSQSWPYASAAFPELSQRGAYCRDCVYTADDIRMVIREAELRGIRVILEVDLPGHCQSIGASHPELLTDCGALGPSEPLDVTEPAVYKFVETLYDEVGDFNKDSMIHIGGDEVSLDCWKNSKKIQDWMRQHEIQDEVELWSRFEQFLLNHTIQHLIKRPIVWQDLLDVANIELPSETIIDVWKEWLPESRNIATKNHEVIYSACWYLDHLDEDWSAFYRCDPRDFNGTSKQKANIIGGKASMWGERVDETNLMARVWPRASAMAEKLWSGNRPSASETAMMRLEKFRCRMLEQGFEASPVWTGTCDVLNSYQSLGEDTIVSRCRN